MNAAIPAAPLAKPSIITFEEWEEQYKPVKNRLGDHGSFDGYMFETYGKEQDKAWAAQQKQPNLIWTVVEDGEDGNFWLLPGWHRVNRFGHFVCKVPWADENITVCDDPEQWFKKLRQNGELKQTQEQMVFSPGMEEELKQWLKQSKHKQSQP